MTAFPSIVPTSRAYAAGDWPIKSYKAMDGVEVRILYGSRRFGHGFDLTYANIPDAVAEQFLQHYFEQQGTYKTFAVASEVSKGWEGSSDFFNAGVRTQYRYAGPPKQSSVYPGVSTIQLQLVATLLPES